MNYTAHLGSHLLASRRAGRGFERAWRDALAALRPPAAFPLCADPSCNIANHACAQIRLWFEQGYHHRPVGRHGGDHMSNLADSDYLTVERYYEAPGFTGQRLCGSGEGCDKPAREGEWLCPEHSAEIHAAVKGSHYRGRDEVEHGDLGVAA